VGRGLGPWAGPARHGLKFKRAEPVRNSKNTDLFGLGPDRTGLPERTPVAQSGYFSRARASFFCWFGD
jgi:hypothetical protein